MAVTQQEATAVMGPVNSGSSGGGLRTHLTRDDIPVLVREITALFRLDAQPPLIPGILYHIVCQVNMPI